MTGNVLLNGKKRRLDYGGVVCIHEWFFLEYQIQTKYFPIILHQLLHSLIDSKYETAPLK